MKKTLNLSADVWREGELAGQGRSANRIPAAHVRLLYYIGVLDRLSSHTHPRDLLDTLSE